VPCDGAWATKAWRYVFNDRWWLHDRRRRTGLTPVYEWSMRWAGPSGCACGRTARAEHDTWNSAGPTWRTTSRRGFEPL